ncbi:MAG: hypothetical protein JW910_01810 [Anaerolineae bacterium]|nr:hypothetical protein [Anaerolineae bacterium]
MSDHAPHNHPTRQFFISPQVREKLSPKSTSWRRLQALSETGRAARRYWVRSMRALQRSPIRGLLVTHRRQFGVSHKSVQDGQGGTLQK